MPVHILLVPGFWLGAWAWDDVAAELTRLGDDCTALTLPGLDSPDTDRSSISLADHARAIVAAAHTTADEHATVLVAHSGACAAAYAATDLDPGLFARVVYVDSGPVADGHALLGDLPRSTMEIPLPDWAGLEAEGNSLEGLDDDALARFRRRAVPQPAGPARDRMQLTDPARLRIPTTVISSSFPAEAVAQLAASGHPMAAELTKLPADYVDLPTGHWPMWSRPVELAAAIHSAAAR